MVPTKYNRFCARLGPCRNRKSLQGLFVSTKKNLGSNVLFTCKFLNKIIEIYESLPLVQLKYSLNSFSTYPEATNVLHRLVTSISWHEI